VTDTNTQDERRVRLHAGLRYGHDAAYLPSH